MKIIQSLWSKPLIVKDTTDGIYRDKGGWFDKQYFYMSWALSCLRFKDLYGNIELVTDNYGKNILIDILELPYDKVVTDLNVLDNYSHHLWALGKIYAYSIQKEPFIHVDSDVFVWSKFPDALLNSEVIAQHIEVVNPGMKEFYFELEQYLEFVPNCIKTFREGNEDIMMANMGIFGGNNIAFIKEYTEKVFEFIDKNLISIQKLPKNKGTYNMIFEQYLFYCLAHQNKMPISTLFAHGSPMFEGLVDFCKVPSEITYVHVLGSYKKYETICNDISNRLFFEYPTWHKKINHLINMNIL